MPRLPQSHAAGLRPAVSWAEPAPTTCLAGPQRVFRKGSDSCSANGSPPLWRSHLEHTKPVQPCAVCTGLSTTRAPGYEERAGCTLSTSTENIFGLQGATCKAIALAAFNRGKTNAVPRSWIISSFR